MTPDVDVAVVGAGMAGLTAAHELRRCGVDVRLFEERPHVGGRMHSFRREGYTLDEGAEQISPRGYRATWELLARFGFGRDEVPEIGNPIGMWRAGQVHTGVADPGAVLRGAGLRPRARLDLARVLARIGRRGDAFDPDRPEATPLADTTLSEWCRQFHPDLHDYLFQPVSGCFFGWNTARSTAAPALSLLGSVGPARAWRTYRDGMDSLARRLATGIDVEFGSAVREVVADGDTSRLVFDDRTITARSVLLCVPAPIAAELYVNPPRDELPFLTACTFTPVLKVSCMLERPLGPVGSTSPYVLLTPDAEEEVLSGVIFDHAKHIGRVPPGRGLLSLMADPRITPGLLEEPEHRVVERLTRAAAAYVPGLDAATRTSFVHSFRHGLPEATPEALRSRAHFAARPPGPVDYAGDWITLRPASEGAVRSGAEVASRTLRRLRSRPATLSNAEEKVRETA